MESVQVYLRRQIARLSEHLQSIDSEKLRDPRVRRFVREALAEWNAIPRSHKAASEASERERAFWYGMHTLESLTDNLDGPTSLPFEALFLENLRSVDRFLKSGEADPSTTFFGLRPGELDDYSNVRESPMQTTAILGFTT